MPDAVSFNDLKSEVVDAGRCVACGTCSAVCPVGALTPEEGVPRLTGSCTLCGLCHETCPRTKTDWREEEKRLFGRVSNPDEPTGIILGAYAVKAKPGSIRERCQDGGAATALMVAHLKEGGDAEIVAGLGSEPWKPEPVVATDEDTVTRCAGTKYSSAPMISGLAAAVKNGKLRVGLVSTPCQIQALRKLEAGKLGKGKLAKASDLKVGLFCMETFDYTKLTAWLREQGVEPSEVKKFEIKAGRFVARREGAPSVEAKIGKVKGLMRGCCKFCTDYTAEYADVSVGNVGSPEGFSTVIVRTQKGKEALEAAEKTGLVEVQPIALDSPGLQLLSRLAAEKKKRSG